MTKRELLIFTGFSVLSWLLLLHTYWVSYYKLSFQTFLEDTCLFIGTEFHKECQENAYYDYLLIL